MTLKGQILVEFRDICRVSEAITAKRMKIDRYCHRRNPLKARFSDVQVTLISQGYAMGHRTSAGLGKQAIFELNASISRKR